MISSTYLVQEDQIISGNHDRRQLLSNLPVREQKLHLAGIETSVLTGGDGPPVILLHGQGEFALTWLRVIPELAKSHRIIVPDLPGHGASGLPDDLLDTRCVLAWLDELIGQTCPAAPILVGHLLGGAIAARYASQNNDHINQLVLVDSMGLSWYRPSLKFSIAMIGFITRPTERSQDRLFQGCFTDFSGLRHEVADIWQPLSGYALDRAQTPEMKTALQNLMPRMGVPAISKAVLKRISVPTTLIWGKDDLQVRIGVARQASKSYGWPLHVIENAADDPAFEQPEKFLQVFYGLAKGSTG